MLQFTQTWTDITLICINTSNIVIQTEHPRAFDKLSAKTQSTEGRVALLDEFSTFISQTMYTWHEIFSRLTSCLSSSERAPSIWSNNAVHLAWCAWAVALSKWPTEELCVPYELFSWLDENSLENKQGNSVWITARTLFLLRRNAANIERSTL